MSHVRKLARAGSLLLLPLLLPLPGFPSQPATEPPGGQESVEELMLHSGLVFRGTVAETQGVRSRLLSRGEAAVAVRIEEAFKVPRSLGRAPTFGRAHDTILVRPKADLPALRQGQEAVFFGQVERAGKDLVIRELNRISIATAPGTPRTILRERPPPGREYPGAQVEFERPVPGTRRTGPGCRGTGSPAAPLGGTAPGENHRLALRLTRRKPVPSVCRDRSCGGKA